MKTKSLMKRSLLFLVVLLSVSCSQHSRLYILTSENVSTVEIDSLTSIMNDVLPNHPVQKISFEVLPQKLPADAIVWYHREDTIAFSEAEKTLWDKLNKSIYAGTKLILSMDAVRLLNAWQIEKSPITAISDTIVDYGNGRKLGFHANGSHPLFEGMHGGAYIWQSHVNHTSRTLGFSKGIEPGAEGAKVIGINWAYITYHEDRKLLWETPVGKGKILAIGAYTHFKEENHNKLLLSKFVGNCITYLSENKTTVEENYWHYGQYGIKSGTTALTDKPEYITSAWNIESLDIEKNGTSNRSKNVVQGGSRAMLFSKENAGVEELWTHPFMAWRDIEAGIQLDHSSEIIWLKTLNPEITVRPDMVVRNYQVGSLQLKEYLVQSHDKPASIIHWEWEDAENAPVFIVSATSNLRYMWPYSNNNTGDLIYSYDQNHNYLIVESQFKNLKSMIGFNQEITNEKIGQYESSGEISNKKQVTAVFELAPKGNSLDCYIAGSSEGLEQLEECYVQIAAAPEKQMQNSVDFYGNVMNNMASLTTPNQQLNNAYKWAAVGAQQFVVNTPGVAHSIMAGYASTAYGWNGWQEISGRPGYAWYFGRDAVYAAMALDNMGDFKNVKRILQTLFRYQRIDGKIFHELSTSGSVHYDASDATPLAIILAAHYLRFSGDIEYISEIQPQLEKALDYCYSTDTDGDKMIENSNVGHGWIEGGVLFGAHTTFYLAGLWTKSLEDATWLFTQLGETGKAKQYQEDAEGAKQAMEQRFWSRENQSYAYGLYKDGRVEEEITIMPAVPILFNVTDSERAGKTVDHYASNNISTQWGVRMVGNLSPKYKAGAYHHGSVWPLYTGWVSLAEYATGRYTQGFTHLMSTTEISELGSRGRINEVVNGDFFNSGGVCAQQCWSETFLISSLLEGMLGVDANAMTGEYSLSPRFPWHWDDANIKNLKMGEHELSMHYQRNGDLVSYHFTHNGSDSVIIHVTPCFAPGTKILSVTANDKICNIDYQQTVGKEGVNPGVYNLTVKNNLTVEFKTKGGIGALPVLESNQPGESAGGLRILSQSYANNELFINIEGIPGEKYTFQVWSSQSILHVEGARIENVSDHVYNLSVAIPEGGSTYETKSVSIKN